ncbi:MAG: hypothetical protein QNJ88_14735 [Acidimicrobiia bacterium]|nr:hypothetical protein [Acidimicrobiia bacterium]
MGRRVGLAVIVLAVAGCSVGDGTTATVLDATLTSATALASTTSTSTPTTTVPTIPGMPNLAAFGNQRDAAEVVDGESFLVDPRNCRSSRWFVTVEMGVAWVVTAPRTSTTCHVWLGGGPDEGAASDVPTTYCRFDAEDRAILIIPGRRGPVRLDDPNCVPTGFLSAASTEA